VAAAADRVVPVAPRQTSAPTARPPDSNEVAAGSVVPAEDRMPGEANAEDVAAVRAAGGRAEEDKAVA